MHSPSNQFLIESYLGTGAAKALTDLGIDPDSAKLRDTIEKDLHVVDEPHLLPLEREKYFAHIKKADSQIRETYANHAMKLDNLQQITDVLKSKLLLENFNTMSLTDKTAETILADISPLEIFRLLNTTSAHKATEILPARQILALTRHTETSEWKKRYFARLETLTAEDFSAKPISLNPVPNSLFENSISKPIHEKPWGVSHSKEVGVISLFPQDLKKYVTPYLLLTSVCLHYIEEIRYASKHFEWSMNHDNDFGTAVVTLIKNNRQPLPFLRDRNVYDETLYWDRALSGLAKDWITLTDIDLTKTGHAIAYKNSYASLNPIDAIWSLNFESSCTYHFKQALWCNIIKSFSSMDTEAYETSLIENLSTADLHMSELLIAR